MRRPADALLLLRVSCVAALAPLAVRLPLPRLSRLLTPGPRRRAGGTRPPVYPERLLRCFEAAVAVGHPIVRPGCLTRAVTLYWFLSRGGLPVELRFGLATEGQPVGHAWLVADGAPFLEKDDPAHRFTVTYRVGSAT